VSITVLNPDYEPRIRERFSKTGAMETLGARLNRLAPGEADLEVTYRHGLSQTNGFFHGGIIGTMLDTSCGYAALTLMRADDEVLTVEFKTNFLAPAAGNIFIARSRVIRAGRSIIVCEADGVVVTGGQEKLVAKMTATMMAVQLQSRTVNNDKETEENAGQWVTSSCSSPAPAA
jgi:uncharacterized protein (TIGR00369 family)